MAIFFTSRPSEAAPVSGVVAPRPEHPAVSSSPATATVATAARAALLVTPNIFALFSSRGRGLFSRHTRVVFERGHICVVGPLIAVIGDALCRAVSAADHAAVALSDTARGCRSGAVRRA